MNHTTNVSKHNDGRRHPVYHLTCTCGLSRWCYLTKRDTEDEARQHRKNNE